MPYYLISALCLAFLIAIALGYIFAIFSRKKSRRQKIEFIRQFKKGKCAIIYFAAIPLYLMAYIHSGEPWLPSFFSAINKTVSIVVLRFDFDALSGLMAENALFTACVYLCFTLVLLNAMLFALSFLQERIWEALHRAAFGLRRNRLIVFGYSPENLLICSSEKTRASAVAAELSEKERTELYSRKIASFRTSAPAELASRVLKRSFKRENDRVMLVINTGSDEKNLALCYSIIKTLDSQLTSEKKLSDILTRVQIYVFASPEHEALYHDASESSHGVIRYVNKYKQIALDMIERYPMTEFMGDDEIDRERFILKDKTELNFLMIGFGKTNSRLFLSSVANNQFVTEEDGKIVPKRVKYHIFDKSSPESGKNLNHNYYRYKNEFSKQLFDDAECKDYLPLPELPAEEYYHELDVNSPDFYSLIRDAVSGECKYSYVSIAFGSDLENVDMAKRLIDKKLEWGIQKLYIFVKVRRGGKYSVFERDDCFPIGDEAQVVYNVSALDDDRITKMAMMRNRIYAAEYGAVRLGTLTDEELLSVYRDADRDWFARMSQFERESNVFGCLSIRSKLHLMGLDISNGNGKSLSAEEYLSHYAKGDRPDYYKDTLANGKPVVKYPLDFAASARQTLAIQEHYRWCAFMISHGFIPATRREIVGEENSGKSYALRRHGNLTSFEGLYEFRQLVAGAKGKTELECDVIKYDYQLLDDAFWLLDKCNYSIIKRK